MCPAFCHHKLVMDVPEWSSEARTEVYPERVKFRRGRSKALLAQPPGAASRWRAVLAAFPHDLSDLARPPPTLRRLTTRVDRVAESQALETHSETETSWWVRSKSLQPECADGRVGPGLRAELARRCLQSMGQRAYTSHLARRGGTKATPARKSRARYPGPLSAPSSWGLLHLGGTSQLCCRQPANSSKHPQSSLIKLRHCPPHLRRSSAVQTLRH